MEALAGDSRSLVQGPPAFLALPAPDLLEFGIWNSRSPKHMKQRILAFLALFFFLAGPASSPAASRRVLVWLEGDALAEAHARSIPPLPGLRRPLRLEDADMRAQRAALRAVRDGVRSRLEQLGFVADGETDVVLHALIGRMPEENLEAAAHIRGVRLLRAVREYRKLTDAAVPLIRARDAWPLLGGETTAGAGMRIAVIDTGLDISNPMLQDPRLATPFGFPKGDPAFTNSKVIVARTYVGLLGDPRDTVDAMDRDGHGTFVGGIAAGRRVLAPWAEVCGVAPAAQLGNYRIWGSPLYDWTTDAAIIAAINDAVADGMNVINLSMGAPLGDLPSQEPVPQAVAAAVKAGVVVVVAAGNDGDLLASVSDPANSPAAISVGSSRNSRLLGYPLRVLAPQPVPDTLQRIVAVPSSATTLSTPIVSAPLWHPSDDACQPPASSADFAGKVVVVLDTGACSRNTKVQNIAAAGALAGVIYRSDSDDPREMMFASPPAVPVFQIAYDAGKALVALPGLNGQGQAAIDAAVSSFPVAGDVLSWWSSRGPSNDGELKPDLVAPGENIYSAFQTNDALGGFYSTSQFGMSDGTSFSTPMVLGAAALVKQKHPDWTPAQIKSALVNTAMTAVMDAGQAAEILGVGNGRVDVVNALNSTATFEPVGLSFTSSLIAPQLVVHRALKITNNGQAADTFSFNLRPRTEINGASVTFNPASVSLGPHESATIDVAFQAPATVSGSASLDGRLAVSSGSGANYAVAYWGQVVDSQQIDDLFRIRGDGQTGPISTALQQALAVQVFDADYIGIAGASVKFEITSGGGALSASQVTTDFAGVAQVTLKLPNTPGMVQIKASATSTISRTFTATARPAPLVPQGAVVNAASYTAAISAGSLVSIFGTGLAGGTAQAGAVPLPTTLASTQVLFNGQPAPLFFVSPGQINALVPFELAAAGSAQLQVSVLGVLSPPVSLALAAAAPGILTLTQDGKGAAVAQHTDFSLVTVANPAHPGETIVVYGLGFGSTQPVVTSGVAAPVPPAWTAATPTVRIGSASAEVSFSGLTPGAVGLYQLNIKVPPETSPGDAVPLVVTFGSAASNAVTLPVK